MASGSEAEAGPRTLPPPALLAGIFLIALALRLAAVAAASGDPLLGTPGLDARFYLEAGRALAAGAEAAPRPFFMSPGYTGLVAAFSLAFEDPGRAIVAAQALLDALACVLAALAGGRLFGPFAGAAAGGLLALHGPLILAATRILPESAAAFLVAALLLALPRPEAGAARGRSLLAGLLLGLLALLRSNALLAAPFVAAGLLPPPGDGRWRTAAARAGLLLAGAAAGVAPAAIYNAAVAGDRVLLAGSGGVNFYLGNAPEGDGRFVSLNNLKLAPGRFFDDPTGGRFERTVHAFAEERAGRRLRPSEASAVWFRMALGRIAEAPLAWARLILRKAYLFANAFEVPQTDNLYFAARSAPLPGRALAETTRIIWPLGFAGLVLALGSGPRPRPAIFFLAGFALSVVVFFVSGRHRLPVAPAMAVFAGLACARLAEAVRGGAARRRLLAPALAAGAALACNLNPSLGSASGSGGLLAVPEEYLGFASQHNNLAARLLEAGRPAEAAEEARRGLALAPGHPVLHYNLARALAAEGDAAGAVAALERGLALYPGNPEAGALLGELRARTGDLPGARAALEQAIRSDAGHARSWSALGPVRYEQGDREGGVAALREAIRLAPGRADTRVNLALMLARMGRPEEAAAELRRALEIDPGDARARRLLDSLPRGAPSVRGGAPGDTPTRPEAPPPAPERARGAPARGP
jgi:tetratricopeptide (TPR) repeat protein